MFPNLPFPFVWKEESENKGVAAAPPTSSDANGEKEKLDDGRMEITEDVGAVAKNANHALSPPPPPASARKPARPVYATILIPHTHLPSMIPSPLPLWGGGLGPITVNSASGSANEIGGPPVNGSGTHPGPPHSTSTSPTAYTFVANRRIYTDDSHIVFCAIHSGFITWSEVLRARGAKEGRGEKNHESDQNQRRKQNHANAAEKDQDHHEREAQNHDSSHRDTPLASIAPHVASNIVVNGHSPTKSRINRDLLIRVRLWKCGAADGGIWLGGPSQMWEQAVAVGLGFDWQSTLKDGASSTTVFSSLKNPTFPTVFGVVNDSNGSNPGKKNKRGKVEKDREKEKESKTSSLSGSVVLDEGIRLVSHSWTWAHDGSGVEIVDAKWVDVSKPFIPRFFTSLSFTRLCNFLT